MENKKPEITHKVNFEINPEEETVLRTGEAEPVKKFRKGTHVVGTISTPRIHLTNPPKRTLEEHAVNYPIDQTKDTPLSFSFIMVDRTERSILLREDAGQEWESQYKGTLELDPRFVKFGINTGEQYNTFELADFIRMNRSHFESREQAMLLVSSLRNFQAKVNNEIENKDDRRANIKILRQQTVQSNLPDDFRLKIPIFKGEEKESINVEISIDADNLLCTLESPEAQDAIEMMTDRIIDQELDDIRELHPNIRIFEV